MQFIKKYKNNLYLSLFSLLPVFIWLVDFGVSNATASLGTFVASLGKAVALIGTTLYCLNPFFSLRLAKLETLLGGMNNVVKTHARSGKLAFLLLLLHPIFLGLGRYINGTNFTRIWDWSSLVVLLGILALVGLLVLTSITIYAHIKHQKWVRIHRFFGWLIPVFFLHGLLARGQITQIPALFAFFAIVGIAGFGAFLYRSVFWKRFVKRYTYELVEVNRINQSVAELVLKPKGIAMHFTAGQFAFVSFEGAGVDTEPHPFSFSNAHNGPYVRFTIKALGDDTKQFQEALQPGTIAYLEGPYGRFYYKTTPNRTQVWIAGGIGITPFLSMARSFSGNDNYDIRFFYGTESLDEAVFLNEFLDITRTLPANFHTSVVAKNISGFVTIEMLKNSLGELSIFDYFICGPPGMMHALRTSLQQEGVPQEQIHAEDFSL